MRESVVEKHLKRVVAMAGGRAFKWVSPGCRGVPDQIVLLPQGRVVFVELKAPGKHPTGQQQLRQAEIASMGFDVLVFDNLHAVDAWVESL